MSAKTIFTCDYCDNVIETWHSDKVLAIVDANVWLDFQLWNDAVVTEPNMLHFCSDRHAADYLKRWMAEQRKKQSAPAPVKDPLGMLKIEVDPTMPPDRIEIRNDRGEVLGSINNIGTSDVKPGVTEEIKGMPF